MIGQADDLGGGVFKKRLNNNMHKSIILAKGECIWVYQYLYAKNDRENIDDGELADFRSLAKAYEKLTETQIAGLLATQNLLGVCNDKT